MEVMEVLAAPLEAQRLWDHQLWTEDPFQLWDLQGCAGHLNERAKQKEQRIEFIYYEEFEFISWRKEKEKKEN